jgi:hypothetical protein
VVVGPAFEACVRGGLLILSFLRELELSLRESSMAWTLASVLAMGIILMGSLGSWFLDLVMKLFSV